MKTLNDTQLISFNMLARMQYLSIRDICQVYWHGINALNSSQIDYIEDKLQLCKESPISWVLSLDLGKREALIKLLNKGK